MRSGLGARGPAPRDPAGEVAEADVLALAAFFRDHRCAVLTGAGVSTEAGIPDYRGPGRARRRAPIQAREFRHRPEARRRYWARSAAGWPRFRAAAPAPGHRALAEIGARGDLAGLITQNVDRLHRAAGSRGDVELHGALAEVTCLACAAVFSRDALQDRLLAENPGWDAARAELAPDGDAELPRRLWEGFRVPACESCGGVLKPNVVFFGENVPRARVETATAAVDRASALVVVGSSLAVYSGYRFARWAHLAGKAIAIVNLGPTRADDLAAVKVEARAGPTLAAAAARLRAP